MTDKLLTPGKGKFLIKRVKTHDQDGFVLETKKGDRKVMIVIDATDAKGDKNTVFEHLTMNVAWKVEQICKACNMGHIFMSDATCLDNLDELEGSVGDCIIGISEADGQWPEKTIITKYVVPKASKVADTTVSDFFKNIADTTVNDSLEEIEDQIPF